MHNTTVFSSDAALLLNSRMDAAHTPVSTLGKILSISKDLPMAQKRFCAAEGIDKVITLSDFRSRGFGKAYGVDLTDSGFAGLFARSVVVIDETGKVKYTELVPQIGQEPNYDAALKAI